MTQPDKWDEIANVLCFDIRCNYNDADVKSVSDALRSAYAEGEKAGMERAEKICDAYKWECVKSAEHDPEPMYDRARSYGCEELIERIRAAKDATSAAKETKE